MVHLQNCHILVYANEKAGSLLIGKRLDIAILLLENCLAHGKTDSRTVLGGIPASVKAFEYMRQLVRRNPLSAILNADTGMQWIVLYRNMKSSLLRCMLYTFCRLSFCSCNVRVIL